MAKNSGKVFEEAVKKSVDGKDEIYYYRLRDPASSFNQSSENGLRFSISNDYDCLMYMYPNFFPLELKSTTTTSFSFQKNKKEKSKNIKLNQIEGLTKASKVKGVYAGFLFNFSKKNKTYWLDIRNFNVFMSNTDKKSINENDIIEYEGILVNQKLLRTSYTYHIKTLLEEIIKEKM